MRADASWLYRLRDVSRLVDAVIGSSRNAARILVATAATRTSIARRHHERCSSMLENGIDLDRFRAEAWPKPPSKTEALRVLFVGRLVPFKGVQLLLEAVSCLRQETPVRLRIVGDGPMRSAWEKEAVHRGIDDITEFTGARSLDQVAADMRWAHVFCLPSVRESGGAVLLEAMASGRPVIALGFGGPAEIVDDGVGRCIPLGAPEAVAVALQDALLAVVRAPMEWEQRGCEGRRRAESRYGWDAKIEQAVNLYASLINESAGPAKLDPTRLMERNVHHVYDV
jgi:glycosyltransferase involved in cell wall biosynthesis